MANATDLKDFKVLVVDDAIESRRLMERTLERYGATVGAARNGLEGVTMALLVDYDVILMDIEMPVVDGCTATDQLRKCGFKRPILACSGCDLSSDREMFDDVVSKPVDFLTLLSRLRRFRLLKMVRSYPLLN